MDCMWVHGSAAIGGLYENYDASMGLVNSIKHESCFPNVITYTTVIDGFCKGGRLDEAKRLLFRCWRKAFSQMLLLIVL
jgi:pentatricopeptide repeat protein